MKASFYILSALLLSATAFASTDKPDKSAPVEDGYQPPKPSPTPCDDDKKEPEKEDSYKPEDKPKPKVEIVDDPYAPFCDEVIPDFKEDDYVPKKNGTDYDDGDDYEDKKEDDGKAGTTSENAAGVLTVGTTFSAAAVAVAMLFV